MPATRSRKSRPELAVTAERLALAREAMRAALRSVAQLRQLLPPLPFTADGHLVGSYGEAWAVWMFDLAHLSEKVHDARSREGLGVQIKATFGGATVGMAPHHAPDRLVVIDFDDDCSPSLLYNGPGALPWERARPSKAGGQRFISVKELVRLHAQVDDQARLALVRDPQTVLAQELPA